MSIAIFQVFFRHSGFFAEKNNVICSLSTHKYTLNYDTRVTEYRFLTGFMNNFFILSFTVKVPK